VGSESSIERREALVREIRYKLLAAETNREAEALEKALRLAIAAARRRMAARAPSRLKRAS
jgi:hypothetical protein